MARPLIKFGEYSMDSPDNKRRLMLQVGALRGPYRVLLEPCDPRRSNQQNRWYWGSILPLAVEFLRDAGWDEIRTEADAHAFLARLLLTVEMVNSKTGETTTRVRSTTELTTVEFSQYCQDIRKMMEESGFVLIDREAVPA